MCIRQCVQTFKLTSGLQWILVWQRWQLDKVVLAAVVLWRFQKHPGCSVSPVDTQFVWLHVWTSESHSNILYVVNRSKSKCWHQCIPSQPQFWRTRCSSRRGSRWTALPLWIYCPECLSPSALLRPQSDSPDRPSRSLALDESYLKSDTNGVFGKNTAAVF